MEYKANNYRNILQKIDEQIEFYCKRQNIAPPAFALKLGISESSLRNKRAQRTEYTLKEFLKIQEITGRNFLHSFDEQITAEPKSEYKVTNKIDNLPHSDKIEKIKEAIPAPVFNYYITIK